MIKRRMPKQVRRGAYWLQYLILAHFIVQGHYDIWFYVVIFNIVTLSLWWIVDKEL